MGFHLVAVVDKLVVLPISKVLEHILYFFKLLYFRKEMISGPQNKKKKKKNEKGR